MQTVPSLVGSGTAIAAAASGLVFGQHSPTTTATTQSGSVRTRRSSHRRTVSADLTSPPDSLVCPRPTTISIGPDSSHNRTISHPQPSSRPPLSRYQRPKSSQVPSLARPIEPSSSVGRRDSVSSNGSWIRRLSIRPLSQHGSARSSIVVDSPSVTFSNPWPDPNTSPATYSHTPNKLIKRPSTARTGPGLGDVSPRQWPKGHLSTLRRPTTSHQRAGALQLFRPDFHVTATPTSSTHSFDRPIRPEELLGVSPFDVPVDPDSEWTSFFHSRASDVAASPSFLDHPGDASLSISVSTLKRISPAEGVGRQSTPHLVKPRMLSSSLGPAPSPSSRDVAPDRLSKPLQDLPASAETPPPTRTIRSLSASFSSASSWVSKRSDSLRRSKRGSDRRSGKTKRHVSDSQERSGSCPTAYQQETSSYSGSPIDSSAATKMHLQQVPTPINQVVHRRLPIRDGKPSCPQAPLPSTHSSLARGVNDSSRSAGRPRGTMARQNRPNHASGSSTSSTVMSQFARVSLHDRSPVMEGSDGEARGFTSGDDDDTDLKSDTVFDSLRTLASSRARVVETPLESVYDESPPSTAGNGRTKRLSVQEMLGRSWDEGNRIMEEEDENHLTSARAAQHGPVSFSKDERSMFIAVARPGAASSRGGGFVGSPLTPEQSPLEATMDDVDDEDWTRDDDIPFNNSLSAPPKGSSARPRGMHPKVQIALPSVETDTPTGRLDRPLSNLFDWSEPSVYGKHEGGGNSLRPRTAYAIPLVDSRGGRTAIRRGPTPTHVRSQSVPVVHDSPEESKPSGPKYGTWGLGTKTVSEDWDEDFEFGAAGGDDKDGPDGRSREDAFAVPESIRATQPSVRAHSGQIRELSLLVNDLKRLFRHGRELDMLNGEQTGGLWREAEGIITLASPDEDDATQESHLDIKVESNGYDSDQWGASIDSSEPSKWKTAVVRERHSPRRRSVFSPEDDIFGASWPLPEESGSQQDRPAVTRQPEDKASSPSDVSGVVRCVMESLRKPHRPSAEPARPAPRCNDNCTSRVQFDTNNLKELVKRAGELRDALSDMIRKADWMTQSPAATARHECRLDSSPAFTRMFDDPCSSPPRRTTRSRGSNSLMEGAASPDKSPSSPMGPQAPAMTVK
ncbi:hypothetical protein XA68_13827 [Ophiocordyceps unilateralis]|uniref:Uncharacterized protein n=1 Tax=Ophiocordyceps unilateralis TaxID=268505 RepID=A0A2A9PM03_OPHUN|nr:hypothetical protein XA68_13827 [Ophiocordyceps unilateralis]